MTFGSVFGRTFSPTFQPSSQAAASSASTWWDLNGTITSCVAAYQPKGAASYAASKVNLANPGTYNATDGTAYPTWDTSTGWKGDGALSNGTVLKTGITGYSNTWTLIARYSGAQNSYDCMLGATGYSGGYQMWGLFFYHRVPYQRWYCGGSSPYGQSPTASGVMALAGTNPYLNGTDLGDMTASTFPTGQICILAEDSSGAHASAAYIQACAIYNATLTGTQIGLLTTAMAAL